jgi:hypothetical protein
VGDEGDSIGASLVSENEFDWLTRCTSVESRGENKIGLRESETRATLDRHNKGVDDTSDWSSRLELAQMYTETMRALGDYKSKVRIRADDGHGQSDTSISRASRSATSAGGSPRSANKTRRVIG